jgi:hypothetical protein
VHEARAVVQFLAGEAEDHGRTLKQVIGDLAVTTA